ncbi:hypothetical protein NDU88_002682 [Pleurodeles waltl]|uniref:Uncharacterized protein n=1 Tax=Pleurodeles waltl TaxID=8319 RepID=A0AAV7QDM5_PLEWA|nr:hypothetical protein NDU88_002682 [Pleurodeles waltl]
MARFRACGADLPGHSGVSVSGPGGVSGAPAGAARAGARAWAGELEVTRRCHNEGLEQRGAHGPEGA